MIESVRRATPADVGWCVRCDTDQRQAAVDQRGGPEMIAAWPDRAAADWLARIAEPNASILVAELDSLPVGFAVAELCDSVVQVERIYMEPGFRELGLGDALLETLMAWGIDREALAIEALALPGDRETKNMFERHGIKARALIVRAAL